MSLGLVGRKVGMTRVFTDSGESVPVTVIDCGNNRVTQIKTAANDGYSALQVAFGKRRKSRVSKAEAGHLAKAGVEPGELLKEFRVAADDAAKYQAGAAIGIDLFAVGQTVDVMGVSKGKGFSGVIKRHNFSSNRASHGNSVSTNKPGSIGQRQDPGRVFPGKKMAGQMGNEQQTIVNLTVVRVDTNRQLLLVRGAVPGASGGHVIVRPGVKARPAKAPGSAPAAKAAPAKAK